MKILDTDHCVAILRRRLDVRASLSATERLAVSTVTVAELMHGAHKSARPAENVLHVDVLLATLEVLAFDEQAARWFGRLKADLERAGTPISDLDLQIASVALRHQVTLLTHNRAHFERVPGLSLGDWL